jgi:hypothetical protein
MGKSEFPMVCWLIAAVSRVVVKRGARGELVALAHRWRL